MKCEKRPFLTPSVPHIEQEPRAALPDTLTDSLTGETIPFTNLDYIRQSVIRFLCEERGFQKTDFLCRREIVCERESERFTSPLDLVLVINGISVAAGKCASGSLVTRRRQIVASARLLESYVVPFAFVANGKEIELLDSWSEEVRAAGFAEFPSRSELEKMASARPLKEPPAKKLLYEERILRTYDGICCHIPRT